MARRKVIKVRRGAGGDGAAAAPSAAADQPAAAGASNPFAGVSLTPAPAAASNPFAGVSLTAPAAAQQVYTHSSSSYAPSANVPVDVPHRMLAHTLLLLVPVAAVRACAQVAPWVHNMSQCLSGVLCTAACCRLRLRMQEATSQVQLQRLQMVPTSQQMQHLQKRQRWGDVLAEACICQLLLALVVCTLPPPRVSAACWLPSVLNCSCTSPVCAQQHAYSPPSHKHPAVVLALQAAEGVQPASTAPAAASEQPAAPEQQEGSKPEESKTAAATTAEQQAEGKTEDKPAAASTSGGFGGFGGFAGSTTGGFGGFSSTTGGFGGFGGAGGFGGLAASAGKGESSGCGPRELLSVHSTAWLAHPTQPRHS
jgi:hypothetical protein